jgi:hypothetical protein
MTELATLARNCDPPSTIHSIYADEKTVVQIALNKNMISLIELLMNPAAFDQRGQAKDRVRTHSEW